VTNVSSSLSTWRPNTCGSACESTAFGICESKASTAQTLLQQPILFFEVLDRLDLPAVDRASKQIEPRREQQAW
jgi:hypothetical protein